jgi:glycogen debranching enzyme
MTTTTKHQLWELATTTLEDNWRHDHIVPSRLLYPHQWSWDSGFTAVGLAHVAPERAWQDLRSLFRGQWADGRVPHIVFDVNGERDYFPGSRFWRSTEAPGAPAHPTSGIVQPPVHALAAWELYQRSGAHPAARATATAELRALYPKLMAQQRYQAVCRDIGGGGLAALVHPWESGQDNSPAWDQALARVPADTGLVPRQRRRDLSVSQASHRPTDADYSRYIAIAQAYRDCGYVDDGPGGRYLFLTECPTFNAISAAAEHALAAIAEVVGADPAPHRHEAARITAALVERLFNPDTGMFHARDLYTGQLSPVRCIGGLVPLLLPDLPSDVVGSLLARATSPGFGLSETMALPLPSYERTAPDLDPVRYWRGPIWVNMNWLIWRGLLRHGQPALAAALRTSVIDMVQRWGCFEYFHAFTGEGVGAVEFSWTAALALDLLADRATSG